MAANYALKQIPMVQENSPKLLDTHLLAIEVYTRKGRFLKSLQAIKRAAAQGPKDHPALHRAVVRFLVELHDKRAALDPAIEKVLELEMGDSGKWGLPGLDKSPADYNEEYIKSNANSRGSPYSIPHGVAAAWSLLHISKGDKSQLPRAIELVMNANDAGTTLKQAIAAKNTLKEDLGFSAEDLKAFCEKARKRFPLATALAPA